MTAPTLYCSFCGRSQHEVLTIIAGAGVLAYGLGVLGRDIVRAAKVLAHAARVRGR